MMASLKLPFSLVVLLVVFSFLFLTELDYSKNVPHSYGNEADVALRNVRKTGHQISTEWTETERYDHHQVTAENATSSGSSSYSKMNAESGHASSQTTSPIVKKIRKVVSAVVDLQDAIQIFHRRIRPHNFRYFNASERAYIDHNAFSSTISERPRTCALVGNSGILTSSKCGNEIDSHDFVMRMNLAPVAGIYADDVGSKISISTMNREQLLLAVRCARNWTVDISQVCADLRRRMRQVRDGLIWYTKGGYQGRLDVVAADFESGSHSYNGSGRHAGPQWAYSPRVMEGVNRLLWKNRNPSTGLLCFSLASLFCDDMTLYGFYPFERDSLNRTLSYHYYEPKTSKIFFHNKHRFSTEFKIFQTFARNKGPRNRVVTRPCR